MENAAQPAYERMAQVLRGAIQEGKLAAGAVVLEGQIAGIFGSSRSPARRALGLLLDEKLVHRFGGRGVAVGPPGGPLLRQPIDAAALGLLQGDSALPRVPAWRRAYDQIERDLIQCSVLGAFRINEVELARHYRLSRTVAHQVLMQAEAIGIVSGHWQVVPLHRERLRNLYALRRALEPAAIEAAAPAIPDAMLHAMAGRLHRARAAYPAVHPDALDQLELDLHVDALSHAGNPELLQALSRTRCIIISSKHLIALSGRLPGHDPFLEEHGAVLAALRRRDGPAAALALAQHLCAAERKVQARLEAFSASHAAPDLPYLTRHKAG